MHLQQMLWAMCAALLLPQSIAAAEPPATEQSASPAWRAAMLAYKPSVPDTSLGTGELVSRLELVENDRIERAFRATRGLAAPVGVRLYSGGWQFEPSQDGAITRAWLDNEISNKNGYRAERIGYCKDERTICEAWFEAGRHRSPRPSERAGKLAYEQWRNRVLEESCVPGVDYRPSKVPLELAAKHSRVKNAYLILELTLNACGDVRDATVHVSSGKKELDENAVRWARRARYVNLYELAGIGTVSPARGRIGAVLFEFGD
jgi:TonB family protein